MMYVVVYEGGVTGFDWIILGFGILADIASWSGGGRSGYTYRYDSYAA